jgi:hypothetical protein
MLRKNLSKYTNGLDRNKQITRAGLTVYQRFPSFLSLLICPHFHLGRPAIVYAKAGHVEATSFWVDSE